MIFNLGGGAAAPVLTSIAVTTQPTKKTYWVGESFSKTDMVVTAYFDDGTSTVITGYTHSPTVIAATTSSITISYTNEGVTKTTAVSVTVTGLRLYASGNQYTSVTGGWLEGSSGTTTFGTDYIQLQSGIYACDMKTANSIDLSPYSRMDVEITSFTGRTCIIGAAANADASINAIGTWANNFDGPYTSVDRASSSASQTVSLDISSVSSACYIHIAARAKSSTETSFRITSVTLYK